MGDRYFMSNLEGLMKKHSVKTSKKYTRALEDRYNFVLDFSDTMNNLCDSIMKHYYDLLEFEKTHINCRATCMLDYMSIRIHIVRSLKKRLRGLYSITDHKDFIDEFDNIHSRYNDDLLLFIQVLDYVDYIFIDNATKENIVTRNLSPILCFNNISDTQYDKSAYCLVIDPI